MVKSMLTLNLPKQAEDSLAALAARSGRAESDYLADLVCEHLSEMAALATAEERLSAGLPPVALADVKKHLGLED